VSVRHALGCGVKYFDPAKSMTGAGVCPKNVAGASMRTILMTDSSIFTPGVPTLARNVAGDGVMVELPKITVGLTRLVTNVAGDGVT
jgi:hypothetical protein